MGGYGAVACLPYQSAVSVFVQGREAFVDVSFCLNLCDRIKGDSEFLFFLRVPAFWVVFIKTLIC